MEKEAPDEMEMAAKKNEERKKAEKTAQDGLSFLSYLYIIIKGGYYFNDG